MNGDLITLHQLLHLGILEAINKDLAFIPAFPDMDMFYSSLLHAIQDPGVVGDMLTSAGRFVKSFHVHVLSDLESVTVH